MKAILRIILYISVLLPVFAAGCDEYEAETNDYYSFKVIATGGSFQGHYIIDSNDLVEFSSSPVDGSTVLHSFKKNMTNPGEVRISVAADTEDASLIEIIIYVNSKEVSYDSYTPPTAGGKAAGSSHYIFDTSEE